MKPCKRVAVVGGGYSGIMCVRSLQEEGITPVCFEKSPEIGGTWRYREKAVDGIPSTMWSTIINHSKEMGAVSNEPPPAEYPNYMRHFQVMEYFESIVEKYDLSKHIICNREVVSVKMSEDYEKTGRWVVVVKNAENGEITPYVFDGVLICVGHITYPKMVQFPGLEMFTGTVTHSHDLKKVQQYSGKRVVVIGTGCSALDAAVEISNVADQVYLSVRTPTWIMPRIGPYGFPMDYVFLQRYYAVVQETFPLSWVSKIVEKYCLDSKFSHKLYGINPKYPLLARDPVINDVLPSKLLSGSVILKKDVNHFVQDGIYFQDNEDEHLKIDAVVMATGYDYKFPFLEEGIISQDVDKINLYKCVFPPHLKYPTLAFIGFILTIGPGFPIGELQSRWASYLMSGHGHLPNKETMIEDIKRRYEENTKRYSPSEKMSFCVDYIPFMNDIASQFGVKPNFWKMMFTDHQLFKACVFGPCLPYQYRLEGRHKWAGARRAILTSHQRVRAPFGGQQRPPTKRKGPWNMILKYSILVALLASLISRKVSSFKYYFLALLLPYLMSLRSFSIKCSIVFLLLPFYVTYEGFIESYFITILVPAIIGMLPTF